jgi:Cu/Ag efflux pump CusA
MPPNASDAYVILKPRDEWPDPDLSKDELVEEMETALGGLIGKERFNAQYEEYGPTYKLGLTWTGL